MMHKLYLLLLLTCFTVKISYAQETAAPMPDTVKAWKTGAGFGFDFAQLLQLNPRQGAGQNRIGLGTATNFFANYKKGRIAWDNLATWQFSLQKLGSGPLTPGTKIPFQKAIDELRLNSKVGYKTSDTSKFFYAADFSFFSQLTPTYRGTTAYPGNFLSDISGTNATPLSEFFAPATITISAGMDYKPTPQLSIYYSPFGGKFIIVTNDSIASTGIQGNPVTKNASGTIVDFQNVSAQLGSLLRVNYTDKYFKERFTFTSSLLLFSDYLQNPENIDVDWTNQLALNIFKGLQLALTVNAFYDDNIQVQITDNDAPNGVSGLGKRVSLTQQLLLKYNVVF